MEVANILIFHPILGQVSYVTPTRYSGHKLKHAHSFANMTRHKFKIIILLANSSQSTQKMNA
jgi:NurA-like 5'-3' nuclease